MAAGGLIALFGGQAWVQGNVLTIPGFSVRILDLCNGVEATLLLWTAMLAFPAPWRYRLWGLLIGLLGVQALNLARIISLVYLGVWNPAWFYWVHWYVWDALIGSVLRHGFYTKTPNSYRLINRPITMSCILSSLEKQMVFRY